MDQNESKPPRWRREGVSPRNKLAQLGVRLRPSGRFEARIAVDKLHYGLGLYGTLKEAVAARDGVDRHLAGRGLTEYGSPEESAAAQNAISRFTEQRQSKAMTAWVASMRRGEPDDEPTPEALLEDVERLRRYRARVEVKLGNLPPHRAEHFRRMLDDGR